MIVKIMDNSGHHDSDPHKTYTVFINVTSINLNIVDDKPTIYICFRTGTDERYDVFGDVYIMNDAGKMVATYLFP